MKLSPPASSSDIELAREIARRLHQQRRREDRPATSPLPYEAQPSAPAPRPTAARGPAPLPWEPPSSAPRTPAPPAFERAPASPRSLADEPAPPSWDSLPVDLPRQQKRGEDEAFEDQEPEDALDALTAPARQASAEPEPEPAPPAIDLEVEQAPSPAEAAEPEDPATFDEADAYGGSPEASPFDEADALEPPDLDSPEFQAAVAEAADAGAGPERTATPAFELPGLTGDLSDRAGEEEELFDDAAGPSWGDIVEGCMGLAHAHGALLADAAGELVAARGEWPDPGAEAIAAKLVAMMDRALKDAPTRSVSAPVGAQHLTAWRVPLDERLLTVVFIADSQVRAEARPAIDAEVRRGATA